ncbi:MAG: hypothetical protein ACUVXG_07800 [Anaerolineae bacterium]
MGCRDYLYNLCYAEVEKRIALGINSLRPDVVALQEVTDPKQCERFTEKNPAKVCYDHLNQEPLHQIRRLVGSDYTIVCDSRNHYECVAVRKGVGRIEGCGQGELCMGVVTIDSPGPGCDAGFTVSGLDAVLNGQRVRILNAHLNSGNADCREWTLRQIFEGVNDQSPMVIGQRVLLLGDFNFDPFRQEDKSTELWERYVGMPSQGKPFWYHSGPVEAMPPFPTWSVPLLRPKTLDFVVSNFASGTLVTLGEAPGTCRLDGGHGMDHRALFGVLCIE